MYHIKENPDMANTSIIKQCIEQQTCMCKIKYMYILNQRAKLQLRLELDIVGYYNFHSMCMSLVEAMKPDKRY